MLSCRPSLATSGFSRALGLFLFPVHPQAQLKDLHSHLWGRRLLCSDMGGIRLRAPQTLDSSTLGSVRPAAYVRAVRNWRGGDGRGGAGHGPDRAGGGRAGTLGAVAVAAVAAGGRRGICNRSSAGVGEARLAGRPSSGQTEFSTGERPRSKACGQTAPAFA